ncbi:MAG: redoxin [Ferruginibacter sp.]|nr:redoxin [Ferruginibacter sp.]
MKNIFIALFAATFFLSAQAQPDFTALKLNPAYPKPNKELKFLYNKNFGSLIKKPTLEVTVYQFSDKGLKVSEPVVKKAGTIYQGSVMIDSNTTAIAFGFSSGEEKDINAGKGYISPVYGPNNRPLEGYYTWASQIQAGYGEYLFGMPNDATAALRYLEDGIKEYPALKKDPRYFNAYLGGINRAKKKEAPELIAAELATYESQSDLPEAGYATLAQWYTRDKKKAKADSLLAAMKIAYPHGDWVKNELLQPFYTEKNADKKLALYKNYIEKYPVTEKDKAMDNYLRRQIASAYATEKNYSAYEKWNGSLLPADIAANNNDISWNMAEADGDIAVAKKMSWQATSYAKAEMQKPSGKRPDGFTSKQWLDNRQATYSMFADTYAFILYKQGEYKTGLPYAKDAATIRKLKDAEYNERYALLAEKALPAPEAKKLIEKMVEDGAATSKTKEALKNLYVAEKKSADGFEAYLVKLESAAKMKRRAEIAKTMINEASPKFSLKDFEGRQVSLADLKGKVVIVDFWATWCGPCIASMPGMNKALAKYKDDDNVKFLFVDTWETVENKLQNAKDFMQKKQYPFYVLMDNEDKMVSDFGVSGIPTKFVIDKDGKIRFKAIGYMGSEDGLVDEIATMIELASK